MAISPLFYLSTIFLFLILFLIILVFQIKRVAKEVPHAVKMSYNETELSRDLKLRDITLLGVGAMIGAGIFVLTGLAAGIAGPGLILAFLLNGFLAALTALIYAELGSAVPEAGGGYLWVKSSMGKFQAFQSGWMSWLAHIVAGSLYALGFGSYFTLLFQEIGWIHQRGNAFSLYFTLNLGFHTFDINYDKFFAIIVIMIFVFINLMGSSETGSVGNIITITKIIILVVFIVSGLIVALKSPLLSFMKINPVFPEKLVQIENLHSFLHNPITPVFIAMGFTFIAFEGYEIIVQTGEEVQEPNINIPKAIFYALMIVVPIYIFVGLVSLISVTPPAGVASWQYLSNLGELGIAEVARQFMPFGIVLMLFGGLVSTLSALNATTYSSARVAFVMGRDELLPKQFNQVNSWRRTPHVSIMVSGLIMIFIAGFTPISDVASAADLLFVILFIQVNYAVKGIRKKYEHRLFYGYKLPMLNLVFYLGIITKIFLGVALIWYSGIAFWGALAWLLIGTVVWYAFIKPRLKTDIRDSFEQYIVYEPEEVEREIPPEEEIKAEEEKPIEKVIEEEKPMDEEKAVEESNLNPDFEGAKDERKEIDKDQLNVENETKDNLNNKDSHSVDSSDNDFNEED